ncbi:TonB-dependent receptor [Sphingorhabdus lacus]|nr:TonB-dependent receptor [Sphingorhabdus lacus]
MKSRQRIAMLASACSLALSAPSFAQQTAQSSSDSTTDGEEIIVTATLREASVQDIPVAVTAVSPVALERQGVADVKLLSTITPSFAVQSSQSETGGVGIRIRGVGTTGNNPGLETSVGIFIDGVYQSRPTVAFGELVDIERVEVLRGPQGTLFGRNTSAGAISIVTKKPSLTEFRGFANATYGNYDLFNLQGGVSGPIAENVGFGIAGSWRKRDGVIKSATGATSNDKDRWLLRGQLYFEPSDALSIRILGDYSKIDEKCCDGIILQETGLATQARAAINGLPNTGVTFSGPSALNNLRSNSFQFRNGADQWGISGELNYDFGGAKLTYIGGYRDFESFQTSETGLTSFRMFTQGLGGQAQTPGQPKMGDRIKTLTQELRLQGGALDGKLDWLLGAYYSDEDLSSVQTATLGPDFQRALAAFGIPSPFGAPPALPPNPAFVFTAFGNGGIPVTAAGANAANLFTQSGKSYSIFTHNVFNLTDKLSVTVGARYVDERKEGGFSQLQGSNAACAAAVRAVLTNALPNPALAPLALGNCFPIATPVNLSGPGGIGRASSFLPLVREYSAVFKDDALTYTAQLAYKPNADMLLYGSFSHGFKSGGINLDATAGGLLNSTAVLTTGAAPQFADPRIRSEKVDAYELGLKATFGRINANVALFHMDMTDYQVLEFDGVRFTTFNVPSVKSTGLEVEVFGKLADHFSMNLAGTFLNTRAPNDCAVGAPAAQLATISVFCGNKLNLSPSFSSVAGLTYDGPMGGSGWGLVANVNLQYSDSYRTSQRPVDTNGLPIATDIQENFVKVNARLGFTTPNERFTFEVWGLNLTNEITKRLTGNVPGRGVAGDRARAAFPEEPRTYGITVRTRF